MSSEPEPNLRVVLLGLPADIAESLGQIVSERALVLYIPQLFPILRSVALMQAAAPDLVFAWVGEDPGMSLLEAVRQAEPQIPAVAVATRVMAREILDSLESGAVDYCTPPFDLSHIHGLLRTTPKLACC